MKIFKSNCPYCGTKSVAFRILCEQNLGPNTFCWDVFARCGYCSRGIVATFKVTSNPPPSDTDDEHRKLLGIAPAFPNTGAPKHTPENAARFFEQAMNSLPKDWDAAGSMFRKALDAGLKDKFPKMEGTLYARIEEAAKNQDLTPELAEWAHKIRLDGNDAVHEDLFLEKEAKDLAMFTQLVFQYLFMLPGMLSAARGDPGEAEADENQKKVNESGH